MEKRILSFDEFMSEGFHMSDSAAKRLVNSLKTDWDKNETPLKIGDWVIDTKGYGNRYIDDDEIGKWLDSASSMRKGVHDMGVRQFGHSVPTENILRLDDKLQKQINGFMNDARKLLGDDELGVFNGHSDYWTSVNFKLKLRGNKLFFEPILNKWYDHSVMTEKLDKLLKKYKITALPPVMKK